jgi:hypothetical protein
MLAKAALLRRRRDRERPDHVPILPSWQSKHRELVLRCLIKIIKQCKAYNTKVAKWQKFQ